MDLLQTVKKEGSRGGRADFKWEDVKEDSQRQNYLGHSVMAPVGRWAKGKDLSWYTKAGDGDEADARAEELKKVKEAEAAARRAALGLPPLEDNANLVPVADNRLEKRDGQKEERREKKEHRKRRHRSRDRDRDRGDRRHRSRDRDERRHRSRDREERSHRHRKDEHKKRDRSYSRSRSRSRKRDDRSRSPDRRERRDDRDRNREKPESHKHRRRDEKRRESRSPA